MRLEPHEHKQMMLRHSNALKAIRAGVASTEGEKLDLLLMVVTGVPLDELPDDFAFRTVQAEVEVAPPPGPRPPEGLAARSVKRRVPAAS